MRITQDIKNATESKGSGGFPLGFLKGLILRRVGDDPKKRTQFNELAPNGAGKPIHLGLEQYVEIFCPKCGHDFQVCESNLEDKVACPKCRRSSMSRNALFALPALVLLVLGTILALAWIVLDFCFCGKRMKSREF
jgi:hypothetical protein